MVDKASFDRGTSSVREETLKSLLDGLLGRFPFTHASCPNLAMSLTGRKDKIQFAKEYVAQPRSVWTLT
jgi:hypothetical protein